MARVLTIILNYKTADLTQQSLVAAMRELEEIKGEIILVDNDSRDGSFEQLSKAVSLNGWDKNGHVRVLQAGSNDGFGAGNNFGIRTGLSNGQTPDYIYILNSDAFPGEGAITSLLAALEAEPTLGMAGSYIHGPDGAPHLTTFRFPSILGEFEGAIKFGPVSRMLRRFAVPLPTPSASQNVDWLAGASLMMRSEMLKQIGLFDERFFLYFEETDLCLRAARAGWKTRYVCESRVSHIGGASTGMKTWRRVPQYWLQSRQYYFRKNHGVVYGLLATLAHLTGGALARLRGAIEGNPSSDPPEFLQDMARHMLGFKARQKQKKPSHKTAPKRERRNT